MLSNILVTLPVIHFRVPIFLNEIMAPGFNPHRGHFSTIGMILILQRGRVAGF